MTSPAETTIRASVIVPAHNAAATLPACLTALQQQQTALPYEVIVVDDGSTDDTMGVAATFDVITMRHDTKRGAAAARNSGLYIARGPIACFTDADCEPTPDWIDAILTPFADSAVSGCKGTYATRQPQLVARFVQIEYEDKYDLLRSQPRINFIDTYSAAYRRAVLLANEGFDEQVFFVEDQELSFRLAARGYEMVFQPDAMVYHHHSDSLIGYARKKFMIGYWKAQIMRRFPGRVIQDSHTPQILKAQLLLVAGMLGGLAALLLTPYSSLLLALAALLFLLSCLPFGRKAWPKDTAVALASPFLLLVRAASLGFGYAWGLIRPQDSIGGEHTIDGFNYVVKRSTDVAGALAGLCLTAILTPFIALAIKLDTPGPVIFRQERIGEEGRPFSLFKFRSMVAGASELPDPARLAEGQIPPSKDLNDPRLTRSGRFLRRWSLDELPQFWNVLKGDMSLVGPRPEESCYVAQYNDWQRRRLAVKPGMTGPMQVNGRADLSLDDRVTLELDYIENYSLGRDMRLLLRTLPTVIRGQGAR